MSKNIGHRDIMRFDRVEIKRDEKNKNRYKLTPVYIRLNKDSSIDEITITCSDLYIDFLDEPIIEDERMYADDRICTRGVTFDIFSNYRPVTSVWPYDDIYTIKRIKEADPVEMTLEEIEKTLGRKIKIITK